MRDCEDCKKCCKFLEGTAYGHYFGNGTECKFLGECGCKIYQVRPNVCRNYYCAWAQELLPEEMRPDKCNVLVNVENRDGCKYLRLVNLSEEEINNDILEYFRNWSVKMNAPVIYKNRDILENL